MGHSRFVYKFVVQYEKQKCIVVYWLNDSSLVHEDASSIPRNFVSNACFCVLKKLALKKRGQVSKTRPLA